MSELKLIEKIKELGKREEEYYINEDFAFYKGSPVNYRQIKFSFYERVIQSFFSKKELDDFYKKQFSFDGDYSFSPIPTSFFDDGSDTKEKKESKLNYVFDSVSAYPFAKISSKPVTASLENLPHPVAVVKSLYDKDVLEKFVEEPKVGAKRQEVIRNMDLSCIYCGFPPARIISEKIGIFFNLNGMSITRTNLIYIKEKAYNMSDLMSVLNIRKTTGDAGIRLERDRLSVERISMCFARETQAYLYKNKHLSKIKDLGDLGFTKSFFLLEVALQDGSPAKLYKSLLDYIKTWKGGVTPKRFPEKMRNYYQTVLSYPPEFFDSIEKAAKTASP